MSKSSLPHSPNEGASRGLEPWEEAELSLRVSSSRAGDQAFLSLPSQGALEREKERGGEGWFFP